jgi:D-alanyl-D-alanine dipeptidase
MPTNVHPLGYAADGSVSRRARLLLPTLPLLLSFACAHSTARPRPPAATATAAPTLAPVATKLDAPPPGLVDINRNIYVDLRYATSNNFTGAPLPGYERADRGLLRPAAVAALDRVERALLMRGLSLEVLDAYRPVRATLAMVAWAHRVHRDLLVGPYIAAHSEHNMGTAVDLTLRASGRELDMGAPFDTFGAGAHYPDASGQALGNRKLLRDAMIAGGFHPYDFEWWHFSIPVPGATPLDYPIR